MGRVISIFSFIKYDVTACRTRGEDTKIEFEIIDKTPDSSGWWDPGKAAEGHFFECPERQVLQNRVSADR
jgi:hypothetical protein